MQDGPHLAPGEGGGGELLASTETGAVLLILAPALLVHGAVRGVLAPVGLRLPLHHPHALDAGGELCCQLAHGKACWQR